MSSFAAGFAARQNGAAEALQQAFSIAHHGFAPSDIKGRANGEAPPPPRHFASQPPGPKHFSPADRAQQPTEGWDPLDPQVDEATTFVDPVETARAAGFAEGMAHAQALARESGERNLALIEQIAQSMRDSGRIDRAQLAQRLRDTVMTLVARVIGETGISADRLTGRVEAAIDLLADGAEAAVLRVHPDDIALLRGRLPEGIAINADPAVERGGFVLESASTIVEDGPELWLEQMAQAIERVAMPTC